MGLPSSHRDSRWQYQNFESVICVIFSSSNRLLLRFHGFSRAYSHHFPLALSAWCIFQAGVDSVHEVGEEYETLTGVMDAICTT